MKRRTGHLQRGGHRGDPAPQGLSSAGSALLASPEGAACCPLSLCHGLCLAAPRSLMCPWVGLLEGACMRGRHSPLGVRVKIRGSAHQVLQPHPPARGQLTRDSISPNQPLLPQVGGSRDFVPREMKLTETPGCTWASAGRLERYAWSPQCWGDPALEARGPATGVLHMLQRHKPEPGGPWRTAAGVWLRHSWPRSRLPAEQPWTSSPMLLASGSPSVRRCTEWAA